MSRNVPRRAPSDQITVWQAACRLHALTWLRTVSPTWFGVVLAWPSIDRKGSDMRVSEIFAMGGSCGRDHERHHSYRSSGSYGGRYSYGYYNGYNRRGGFSGFGNRSSSRGEGLLGILG